jgi:hypothetical protein
MRRILSHGGGTVLPLQVGLVGALAALGALGGCGGGDQEETNLANRSGGDGGSGGSGVMFDTSGAGGSNGTLESREQADCVEEVARAETIPVAIYIMFDQSGSMLNPEGAGTRLDAVRAAAADFLRDPGSAGMGVGIGYFGHFPMGQTSCDPADYATPDVEITKVPDGIDALMASMNAVEPVGETPTGAAIRGACSYARAFKQAHPSHVVVNLLLTDGMPEAPVTSLIGPEGGACDPTLEDAVAAAADCATGDLAVPTYVLGVGPWLDELMQIAQAGTTGTAYLVASGERVAAEVLDALRAIRGDALIPCELAIPTPPDGQRIDYRIAMVRYTSRDGTQEEIERVESAAHCASAGGWHYDEQSERIILCPTTCARVSGETGGQIDYGLGCAGDITR